MASTRVIPLDCGYITDVEHSGQQYLRGFGQHICTQAVLWLVQSVHGTAVVDIGPGTPELVKERHGRTLVQAPDQHPLAALERLGVKPEDVDVVVQTHLHWDHCLGLDLELFPGADIFIQRAELAYAAAPYPAHAGLYDATVLHRLLPAFDRGYRNVKVIDGDFKLFKDCLLMKTPGHSPGTQATLVTTDSGVVAIASDNLPLQASWSGRTLEDWIPPGVHVNLDEFYASMTRLTAAADVVLPSHDASVLGQIFD
ncbi:N-acyl homoserine lactonase family protein [Cryptosporangium sp. NPDC048952]|uniref:N-acyl homoserine lactonase family protein n=1 Tax=Cryptosporangium sp. NPDC048952 TaxID=3363961 RepID=UPI00371067F5